MILLQTYLRLRDSAAASIPEAIAMSFSLFASKQEEGLYHSDLLFLLAKQRRKSPSEIFKLLSPDLGAGFREEQGLLCFETEVLKDSASYKFRHALPEQPWMVELCFPVSARFILAATLQAVILRSYGMLAHLRPLEANSQLPEASTAFSEPFTQNVIHRHLNWCSGCDVELRPSNASSREYPRSWTDEFELSKSIDVFDEQILKAYLFALLSSREADELESAPEKLSSSENPLWFAASLLERAEQLGLKPELVEGGRLEFALQAAALFGQVREFVDCFQGYLSNLLQTLQDPEFRSEAATKPALLEQLGEVLWVFEQLKLSRSRGDFLRL